MSQIIDTKEHEVVPYRYDITSYGADYPVDSLVKRIRSNKIFVPPFQRKFVWNSWQASRFIESLVLGLPVPGIFLSREPVSNRLLILDGQQRLMSLYSFYEGQFKGKKFKLQGVQSDLLGKTYETLSIEDQTRLDDAIIHATIIKQEEPDDGESSIYTIFERLNSGGKQLTPQEIRACIYYGAFNELLNRLVQNQSWRLVFGEKEHERLKEQELILRFFALFYEYENYHKPLKEFLNQFMAKNRSLELYSETQLTQLFEQSITFIVQHLGEKAFKLSRYVNAAVLDAVMTGVAKHLQSGKGLEGQFFVQQYQQLIQDEEFLNTTRARTANETVLKKRIKLTVERLINN